MFHTVLLIVLGLASVGILSAIFEALGMRNHPYLSRILAGICVVIAALTHTWTRLLIGMGLAILYLMLRRDWERRAERKKMNHRAQEELPSPEGEKKRQRVELYFGLRPPEQRPELEGKNNPTNEANKEAKKNSDDS